MTFICIQRDSGVDRVVCWLDEVRENPDSFHLSVQPPKSLSVVFPCDPNIAAELWTAVFSPPYPKSERKSAETQRTTSHTMVSFNFFFRKHCTFSPQPMHPLFLFRITTHFLPKPLVGKDELPCNWWKPLISGLSTLLLQQNQGSLTRKKTQLTAG